MKDLITQAVVDAAWRAWNDRSTGDEDGPMRRAIAAALDTIALDCRAEARSAWLQRDLARADAQNKTNIATDLRRDVFRLDQELVQKDAILTRLKGIGLLTAMQIRVETALRDAMGGCYRPGNDCEHGECGCMDVSISAAGAAFNAVQAFIEADTSMATGGVEAAP